MLVDPRDISINRDPGLAYILARISGGDPQPKRIAKGLYEIGHFNFDHYLSNVVTFSEDRDDGWWLMYPQIGPRVTPEGYGFAVCEFGEYGVCDSPEQFLEHDLGKWLVESERNFVVSFSKVVKANQSLEGGWRWHKWGAYIGKHDPQFEYIYDERDEITEVYCYHVYECVNTVAIACNEG